MSTVWHAERFFCREYIDPVPRCRRRVEFIRQTPIGSVGFAAIDFTGYRPCGGRLIDGKCEFCDITTIEGGR